MGRKDYLNDVANAQYLDVPHIEQIRSAEDGELAFTFVASSGLSGSITAMVPDVSEYPKSHTYMLFATDDTPPAISEALQTHPEVDRKSIPQLLHILSKHIKNALATGTSVDPFEIDDDGDAIFTGTSTGAPSMSDEDEVLDDGDNEDWAQDDYDDFAHIPTAKTPRRPSEAAPSVISQRGRNDLLTAKAAGFRIGSQGYLSPGNACYLSLSCRVAKLGISEEAMQAWGLDPMEYLMLVFHFPSGYKDLEALISVPHQQARRDVDMRIGVCDFYKPPSLADAKALFKPESGTQTLVGSIARVRETFISRPMAELLNDRLLHLISLRMNFHISWHGAEKHFQYQIGAQDHKRPARTQEYIASDVPRSNYPQLVMEDEMDNVKAVSQLSFPLVAMQLLLRHFVRCTEFCLVCHTKLDNQLEALKPYVCEKPLCLFQYMKLDGQENDTKSRIGPFKKFKARLNRQEMQLLFDSESCPLHRGKWIVINFKTGNPWHCRVSDVMHPTVSLEKTRVVAVDHRSFSDPLTNDTDEQSKPTSTDWEPIEFSIYEHNFDDLSTSEKRAAMKLLMDLLPSVWEMQQFLRSNPGSTIQDWSSRLPDACVGILRWIIASNRACIMQVDDFDQYKKATKGEDVSLLLKEKKGEQRVEGLEGWVQFRFAMGAPDKEQRFIDSLGDGNSQYPSLFAWHGSPLSNWHSIIREGLDFKETLHGRAHGHGCYHASDWTVSTGYTGSYGMNPPPFNARQGGIWPQSVLKANTAMALNEIVNAPTRFVSHQPYYVVQYTDWIQTRYLFVKPLENVTMPSTNGQGGILPQDPARVAHGPKGPLSIPLSAIPKTRRPKGEVQDNAKSGKKPQSKLTTESLFKHNKKTSLLSKMASASKRSPSGGKGLAEKSPGSDTASMSTVAEDRALLSELATPSPADRPPTPPRSAKVSSTPVTAYKPHSVAGQIPTMPPPSYATPKATMTIQKAFREVVKTQESHIKHKTLAELGWYLDVQHLEASDNLYQWIIDMHSFPLDIPLGQDMQKAGIDAITFEMRFSASFPFSPPFLRVITPRFLAFQLGGGGHVTAGGSICMDLLTSSGWSVAYSIESVLLQVRMALMSTDPRPARLECVARGGASGKKKGGEYGVGEAVDAYIRACRTHGWEVPNELRDMTGTSF
ncbi:MAG: hypothetical protein Q9159_000421 [Coniocarpon cinnabarinum]